MTKKELQQKYPDKTFGEVEVVRDYKLTNEKINWRDTSEEPVNDKGWKICMEHQCDDWVIGNVEDAEKFSLDLIEAIKYCKRYE